MAYKLVRASAQSLSVGADPAALQLVTTYSYGCFFKLSSLPTAGQKFTLMGKWNPTGNQRQTQLTYEHNGSQKVLTGRHSTDGTDGNAVTYATDLATETWFHAWFGINQGGSDPSKTVITLYLDTVLVASTEPAGNAAALDSTANWYFGDTAGGSMAFDGSIDCPMIRDDVYVPDTNIFKRFYDNANIQGKWPLFGGGLSDISGNLNSLTLNNAPAFALGDPRCVPFAGTSVQML